jgi:hypothetical protein
MSVHGGILLITFHGGLGAHSPATKCLLSEKRAVDPLHKLRLSQPVTEQKSPTGAAKLCGKVICCVK